MDIYGQIKEGGKTLTITVFDSDGNVAYQRTEKGENKPGEASKLVNLAYHHVRSLQMARAKARFEQVNAGDSK